MALTMMKSVLVAGDGSHERRWQQRVITRSRSTISRLDAAFTWS
jgi:hypothetical protein